MTPSSVFAAPLVRWCALLLAALLAGQALGLIDVPASLLLGPLAVGAAAGLRGARLRVGALPHQLAQGVAGVMIGHYMTAEIAGVIGGLWPVVLLFAAMTLGAAFAVGRGVGRWTGLGVETSVWGFLPGMAGAVIALAHERGLDSRLVAFMQITRLVTVILVMIGVAGVLAAGAEAAAKTGAQDPGGVLLALGIAALGPAAARLLPFLPGPASLAPLAITAGLQAGGVAEAAPPGWLLAGAYLVLGLQVGLRFTPDLVRHALRAAPAVIGGSLALIGLCALSGAALSVAAGTDLLTGMLSTVPGSVETIALIAIHSGADVSFVMTMQIARMFAVVLIGPTMARALAREKGPSRAPAE
ncbi:AbrB family transcriptional regulator [Rhodovulum sp. DZ06]|uniref:AbrB family transcriptional regulator n=1 Tax=Rhodovulum sp. DZ06 TaxID=3425126 RepID=UPI003D35966B